jgi:hypoxanthine phosphoribosyltransferase
MIDIIERVLFSEKDIAKKVKELGKKISKDYVGKELVLLCILKGASIFMSDLSRAIDGKMSFDFMLVSSYASGTCSTGQVKILKDLDKSIFNKHVIIVEDIVDNGLTLDYLVKYLQVRKPQSLRICALLDKKVRRKVSLDIHYTGFDCPDEFVVGYGLDYIEFYRNLPFIGVIKKEYLNIS